MSLEKIIAENVVRYRKAQGLTQLALCDKSGLNQAQISALERGRPVNVKTLERVANALAIPAYELLRDPKVENKWLRQKLEEIEALSLDKRQVLETILSALLHEEQLQKLVKGK